MKTSWIRIVGTFLVVLSIGMSTVGSARAQTAEIELAADHQMPEGVAFETLATGQGQKFRSHTDAMYLHRIAVDCGEATGKIFGMEQITYVEYGQVDLRDWDSGEVIKTLSAGDSFGPTADESSFFLASATGHNASVYHFSAGGALGSGAIGEELPEMTFETTDCSSGAANTKPAEPAEVTTLFTSDQVVDSMPTGDATLYVGLLTVEPGASIGTPYASEDKRVPYTASGSGVILPLVGGFGDGRVPEPGVVATGPEVAPGTAVAMHPVGLVALGNFGTIPTTALVFGVVTAGDPIFVERAANDG